MTTRVVDSSVVLWGQTVMYTAYCLVIISLVAWFGLRVTRPASAPTKITPKVFYVWVGCLSVLGVSLHLITYNTIPWVKDDLHGSGNVAATYELSVGNHQWRLPNTQIQVPCHKLVEFSVTSTDLTYGFGLFRPDSSMVAQMQVVPGHPNRLLWRFQEDGTFSIRSTEYSGPEGVQMVVRDAVKVSGCGTTTAAGKEGTR